MHVDQLDFVTKAKIRKVWGKISESGFVQEVSTLKGNLGPLYSICPSCMCSYDNTHLVKVDSDSEDIAGWHFKHTCGAKLLVIND